jgi:hypothetical protein
VLAGAISALASARIEPTAGIVFALTGLLLAYLPAYTDRKEIWSLDGDAVHRLGVVLFAAGGALRIWPVFVLGRRFSGLVAIQPGHELVTRGVYGVRPEHTRFADSKAHALRSARARIGSGVNGERSTRSTRGKIRSDPRSLRRVAIGSEVIAVRASSAVANSSRVIVLGLAPSAVR